MTFGLDSVAPGQRDAFAFLLRPQDWAEMPAGTVPEIVQTHGAVVILAGERALKVKRAVRLPYFDFSTLESRRRYVEREVEVNRPYAPDLYRRAVAITRDADGRLALDGAGEPVEWAVEMQRFPQDALLSNMARHRPLTRAEAIALADTVATAHARAPSALPAASALPPLAETIEATLAAAPALADDDLAQRFRASLTGALARAAAIIEARAASGHVRRCHGDLHLGNIVLWQGAPVPFDAIEFDEALATIDTLYDLAFLLMDLERYGDRAAANLILGRYLWRTGDPSDLKALKALPAFMALRAGVRAMVTLDRARLMPGEADALAARARETLALGIALATPAPPVLVAVGGLSGTGKSTLAARLAPTFGTAPGALHLRTDLERKWLAGVAETFRLPSSSYTPAAAAEVFRRVHARAAQALCAGHSVIIDGVYANEAERETVEAVGRQAGVPFVGLWLEAAPDVLRRRIESRSGDASDATTAVLEHQLALAAGTVGWRRIDASGTPDAVLAETRRTLTEFVVGQAATER